MIVEGDQVGAARIGHQHGPIDEMRGMRARSNSSSIVFHDVLKLAAQLTYLARSVYGAHEDLIEVALEQKIVHMVVLLVGVDVKADRVLEDVPRFFE